MQVLLREYNEEQYVWKTAKYDGRWFIVNGDRIGYTNIVTIVNDNRKNHVMCSSCGAFLKNDPKVIEEHRQKHTKLDACLNCRYLRVRNGDIIKQTTVVQKDGSFVKKTEQAVRAQCSYNQWLSYPDVRSEEAKRNCMLLKCKDADMVPFTDFFMQHPGVFDHMAMVDSIIDVGYKSMHTNRKYSYYRLKGRNTVNAIVNSLGIIDCFSMSYGEDNYTLFYSKRYDKLFVHENGNYEPFENTWLPKKTIEYVKRKIAELYN